MPGSMLRCDGADLPTTKSMLLASLARELDASEDFKVLRRVHLVCDNDQQFDPAEKIGVAVDCECTGLDPSKHCLIELAVRRFRFDPFGRITTVGRAYSWLEDPGEPLSPEICRLTGLSDDDVSGQAIDERVATSILASADVLVAHHCAYDRPFVERRLPGCAGRPWACSLREVDWASRGFDSGRNLGWLLAQTGFFFKAHRAGADVDALIALLSSSDGEGCTVLSELLETASKPTWRIAAVGAHFDTKDALKERGYRWDAAEAVWWREVTDGLLEHEKAWLSARVYAPEYRPRTATPKIREVTWETRHG